MADVFLKRITYDTLLKNPQTILECIEKSDLVSQFKKQQFLALKVHFGERGNKSHISPNFLLPLVQQLKKTGTKPFLFETNTLYRGERMNSVDHINLAYNHGFGKLNIPIIIGDGITGNDSIEVEINKKQFKSCFLAAALKEISNILVLSHFTGHMLTGFGAALKNIGMGCASRRGKLAQHCQVSPKIDERKCVNCGLCAEQCSVGAIEKGESKCFITGACIGCAQCVSVCPRGAVDIIWSEEYEVLGEKMVEYAYAVSKGRKCAYINFCVYMTKECDCMNKEETGFTADLGVLFSFDPVAIDKASLDLLSARENRDIVRDLHPQIEYLTHLRYAQELGLGTIDYRLIEL
jgi:uncharacterized protein